MTDEEIIRKALVERIRGLETKPIEQPLYVDYQGERVWLVGALPNLNVVVCSILPSEENCICLVRPDEIKPLSPNTREPVPKAPVAEEAPGPYPYKPTSVSPDGPNPAQD